MRQDVIRLLDARARAAEGGDLRKTLGGLDAGQLASLLTPQESLAAMLGHELRQPLFTIAIASENLRLMLELPDISKAQLQRSVDRIAEQVERAQEMISRSLDYIRGAKIDAGPDDLVAAMRTAIRFLESSFDAAHVLVEQRHADIFALVPLGHAQMEQIFVNVLRNAAESIAARQRQGWDGEGRIGIEFEIDDDHLRCVISDNGAGLADGAKEIVLQPFFTTKSTEGTGLGLYICQQLLISAGGGIRLRRGISEGAEVEIRLPLHKAAAA